MLARTGFFFQRYYMYGQLKRNELSYLLNLKKKKKKKIYLFFVKLMKLNTILSSFKGPFWRKAQIVPHCTCIVEQSIGFADNSNFLFFFKSV